jgi:hypothetical protein
LARCEVQPMARASKNAARVAIRVFTRIRVS